MTIVPLNLPKAPLILSRKDGKVYIRCTIRNKELVCTPEEWVRQHVVQYLINVEGVGKGRIACEYEFKYNGRSKRADIVIFSATGEPESLIECKATTVPLSFDTIFQIAQYNHELGVKELIITNGNEHLSVKLNEDQKIETAPVWEGK